LRSDLFAVENGGQCELVSRVRTEGISLPKQVSLPDRALPRLVWPSADIVE
jgi:hypothetical protein